MQPTSAYIHIPFCAAKCGYCDFNSYAGLMGLAERYVDALVKQIESAGSDEVIPLETVYLGGGTPSILQPSALDRILQALRRTFGLSDNAEVTLEANPESARFEKLAKLREAGYNRISIGAQSFDDETLKRLGRVHTHRQFLESFEQARAAGFDNISFDLMFGLPGQTIDSLEATIKKAAALGAEHISAYCLTIEESTAFWDQLEAGKLELPDDDTEADMLLLVRQMLTSAGYEHYEISNYALAGRRCRHNEVYWRNEQYFGFGTGAVQYLDGERVKWETNPELYIQQIEQQGFPEADEREQLGAAERLGETAMLALRTSDGLDIDLMAARFGQDAVARFARPVGRFSEAGVLEKVGSRVRLTEAGLPLANEVLSAFL